MPFFVSRYVHVFAAHDIYTSSLYAENRSFWTIHKILFCYSSTRYNNHVQWLMIGNGNLPRSLFRPFLLVRPVIASTFHRKYFLYLFNETKDCSNQSTRFAIGSHWSAVSLPGVYRRSTFGCPNMTGFHKYLKNRFCYPFNTILLSVCGIS